MLGHLDRSPGLDVFSLLHDDQPVGNRGRFQRIVRDQQAHAAKRRQVCLEVATHGDTCRCVEGSERLVEQQHAGVGRESTRERDPLAFTARQLRRPGAGPVLEPDAFDPTHRTPSSLRAAGAPGPQPKRHVVEDAQVGEEEVILEHEADGPLLGRDVASGRRLFERLALELDTAGLNRDESRDGPQQGRLAGPVGA